MSRRAPGRGLIVAGTIVSMVGLGVVLVRSFHIPSEWMVLIVGLGLLVAGLLTRLTSKESG